MVKIPLQIKTDRIALRDFQPNDWEAVHTYGCDVEVVRHMDWGPNSIDETKTFVSDAIRSATIQPRVDFELAVIFLQTNELIGAGGVHISDKKSREG